MTFAPAPADRVRPTQGRAGRRGDLEGLRFIAIFLVAAYHVWSTRISGGVDVFLLLSGFFVGGSLWRRFVAGKPPRAGEYLRSRARRLLPTAVTVLAAVGAAFVIIMPSIRWSDGAQETLASLLYFENWYLAASGQEYGAAAAATSPWQHFWSMSVQGQFFIIAPVLFAAMWLFVRRRGEVARRRVFVWMLVVVSLVSFAYATWLVEVNQSVAYYSTPARLWEFFAGTLLAILLAKWVPSSRLWPVVSWAGLALLIAAGFLVDGINVFPGPWALVPLVAAAALVIAGAAPHGAGASRLLALPAIAALGRYAYSFYLWHWPLLVLIAAWRGRESGWKIGAAVLIMSAVLSVATYHLVEKPLRDRVTHRPVAWSRHALRIATVSVAVAVIIVPSSWLGHVAVQQANAQAAGDSFATHPGALVVTDPLAYGSVPETDPIPAVELVRRDLSAVIADQCVTPLTNPDLRDCSYVDGPGLRVAIFGGSHSEHWFEVALGLAEQNNWTLVPFLKAACQPTLPEDGADEACQQWLENSYAELAVGDFDLIITTATRPGGGSDHVPETYAGMLDRLRAHSTVLGIRDNPSFPVDMPECFARGDDCTFPLYSRINRQDPTDALDMPGVAFSDVNDLICPEEMCQPVVGNRLVFRDTGHLSTSYVNSMKDEAGLRWADALAQIGLDVAAQHTSRAE